MREHEYYKHNNNNMLYITIVKYIINKFDENDKTNLIQIYQNVQGEYCILINNSYITIFFFF